MSVILAGYGEAALIWRQATQPRDYICTIGLNTTLTTTGDDVATEVRAAWQTAFLAGDMPSDYTFVGCRAKINLGSDVFSSGEDIVDQVGTSSTSRVTQNVALLVKKRTASSGRRNQGRMFLPNGYLTEAGVGSDGRLDTSFRNGLQTKLNTFLTNLPAATVIDNAVILHDDAFFTPTIVTALTLDSLVATQRRRLRR